MANNFRILTHAPQWVKEFYNWCNSKFIKTVNGVSPDENGNVTVEVGSEGGTTDYTELVNKPSINGIELDGNKTAANLNLAARSHSHTAYASSSHTHSNYASSTHTHSYAPVSHTHSEYAASSHGTHVTSSTCVTSFNGKKGDVSGVSSLTVINTKDGVETNRTGKMTGDVDLTIDSTGDTIITNTYPTAGVTSVSLGNGSSKTGVVNFSSDEIRDAIGAFVTSVSLGDGSPKTGIVNFTASEIYNAISDMLIPPGTIWWFALDTPPSGWAIYEPLLGKYPLGASSSIGDPGDAGLPNITGSFQGTGTPKGALIGGTKNWGQCNHAEYKDKVTTTFDASQGTVDTSGEYMDPANSPYGKSDTVTPPSVKLLPCIKL